MQSALETMEENDDSNEDDGYGRWKSEKKVRDRQRVVEERVQQEDKR